MSNDLTMNSNVNEDAVIFELRMIISKGISSPGILEYLKQECLNKDSLSKLELTINQHLGRIEEIFTLEIFGAIEHISSLIASIDGLS